MPNSVALIKQSTLQKNVNEQVLQNNAIKISCSRRTQCTDVSKWKKMFQACCFFVGRAEKEDSSVIVP